MATREWVLLAAGYMGDSQPLFAIETSPTTEVKVDGRARISLWWAIGLLGLLFVAGCSKTPTKPPGDGTPPAAITSLVTTTKTASSITVNWTAPGDDGAVGTATAYDLRYSTSSITEGNFASASQVSGEPAPAVAGTAEF